MWRVASRCSGECGRKGEAVSLVEQVSLSVCVCMFLLACVHASQ